MKNSKKVKSQIICLCNGVTKETIEKTIKDHNIQAIDEIFDRTTAGVGSCGGSCRPLLKQMLNHFHKNATFLDEVYDYRLEKRKKKLKKDLK